ncbi:hypothetical protein CMUS01_04236 [Colletotrichum musicola]|uniref:Uncharacterized protein n=1 Tax=Colletotrichum musicola TaxID=2175873 RepID=A0A8H6KYF2_9PEZI|nr:hypothetical protein CMUS01_04236 [Colletotrichum musicola]
MAWNNYDGDMRSFSPETRRPPGVKGTLGLERPCKDVLAANYWETHRVETDKPGGEKFTDVTVQAGPSVGFPEVDIGNLAGPAADGNFSTGKEQTMSGRQQRKILQYVPTTEKSEREPDKRSPTTGHTAPSYGEERGYAGHQW